MCLSQLQSVRLAAVLEDCSDQLAILRHTLTVQMSRERGAPAAQERARLAKLRRDCQYIWQQIFNLHLELDEKQSFRSILHLVEEVEQKKEAEKMRREAKRQLEIRQQTLRTQQDEFKEKIKQLKELNQVTNNLKQQMNEQSLQIADRQKLMEEDTELQLHLTQKKTRKTEKLLEDQRELLEKQLKVEASAHEASQKFLQNQHKELQQQLQLWQQRTKQMLQEKEQQLNNVRCKRTVNLDKLSHMRRKFREMEQVVMEDREEQEKLCIQQAEARAATKLQAWWKGCMVRRGLGSFKKTQDNKKGKKKKDVKKEKKK
ncbi:dynein regulatory complex protein 9-like [Echeneis naucrates]|uniref:dynein regulatory complex protein 9-like n=1 Tax=Echeneis naucrates TaxID=173247 RepID=UPI0011138BB2|nr:dynein regulatory complex protein 9-like [Echeneis naucrates]